VSFWCGNGGTTQPVFAIEAEVPALWDCPRCGLPVDPDPDDTPTPSGNTSFKTHLGYVQPRRSQEDGEILLHEALAKLRGTI
jgi:hypothetical protein